jgi:5-methyltetrahydrofolate--homocysteine methyltransferase
MGRIQEKLKEGRVLVSDGAWGTFLHEMGLSVGECPESWNLERPGDVLKIAQSYVDAGSDLILTNSFGGHPLKLASFGLDEKAFEINRAAAEISRRAAGKKVLVLGSIGPTGRMLFMGDISREEISDGFRIQEEALEEGGADGLLVETMSDIEEAVAAVEAAKDVSELEVLCTFTFEKTVENQYRTMMGTGVREAVEAAIHAGADMIGANCGNGIVGMADIVAEIRSFNRDIPVIVHANAGLPVLKDGSTIFPETPEEMASQVKALAEAGANIIGGCCGTTPKHIRLISEALRSG